MKKKIIISILVLVLISVALASFLSRTAQQDASLPATQNLSEKKIENTESNSLKAVAKSYRESSEKYKYQIDFRYPVFDGLTDKKVLDVLNSQLERNVQGEIDKYIAEARRNKIAPIFGYLTGDYEYSISPDSNLSVKIRMEKYLSGGASSQNVEVIWNFDLVSGKQVP